MVSRGSLVFRILAALLVIGVVVAAGVLLYRAGFSQGFLQGGAAVQGDAPLDNPGFPFTYGFRGMYPGFLWPHFGFFPFFGFCLFGLLLLFFFGWVFRPRFWGRPHPGGWHRYGPYWGAPPEEKDRPEGQAQPGEKDQERG